MSAAKAKRSPFEHVLIFGVRTVCAAIPVLVIGLVNLGLGGFQ